MNRFTTAVTVSGDCNLLRISCSSAPSNPTTTAPTWWRWIILGGSGNVSSHSSGYSLIHHGLKRHRLGREGSPISIKKSQFYSRCSRPTFRVLVVSIKKLLVIVLSRPNYFLKVQTIRLRYQRQWHVLCLEAKFRYNLTLIQAPELKCRAGAPSQRTSQEKEMLRLEESSTIQSVEENLLVITVQLKIISRKNRHLSGDQIVLHLIHNFKVRSMNNKN